jgi:hypothetical protein
VRPSGADEQVERSSESSRAEAERQLVASTERYREVVASMRELGRPEAGQHVAVKAVGRAVQLVSFALTRAAEVGVAFERLVELTGWEPDVVRAGLEQAVTEPWFAARLAPPGADARAVARAAARFEATTRLQDLTQRVLGDVDDESLAPAAAELNDLYDRLESTWLAWRQALGDRPRRSAESHA